MQLLEEIEDGIPGICFKPRVDDEIEQVLGLFSSPEHAVMTYRGIARHVGINVQTVKKILEKYELV